MSSGDNANIRERVTSFKFCPDDADAEVKCRVETTKLLLLRRRKIDTPPATADHAARTFRFQNRTATKTWFDHHCTFEVAIGLQTKLLYMLQQQGAVQQKSRLKKTCLRPPSMDDDVAGNGEEGSAPRFSSPPWVGDSCSTSFTSAFSAIIPFGATMPAVKGGGDEEEEKKMQEEEQEEDEEKQKQ